MNNIRLPTHFKHRKWVTCTIGLPIQQHLLNWETFGIMTLVILSSIYCLYTTSDIYFLEERKEIQFVWKTFIDKFADSR